MSTFTVGRIDGPVYFRHRTTGEILLPPTSDAATVERIKLDPRYRDYDCRKVEYLSELEALQKEMCDWETARAEVEFEKSENLVRDKRQAVADRLRQRMASSSCTPYEKDFIDLYLQLREEKREKHRKAFLCNQAAYFHQLEFDSSSKPSDRIK